MNGKSSLTTRKRSRGFGLIDTMLAAAVATVIAGAGFYMFKSLTADSEANNQVNGILDFMTKSKETFGMAGGNWSAFTPGNLIQMNRIPPQFTKDATKIYDAFGNEVAFSSPSAGQGTVSFIMRSPEECTKITQAVADLSHTTSVGAAGGETPVKTGTAKLNVASMATGCAATNRVLTVSIR